MSIKKRKKDHVDLTVNSDVFYRKSAGFDRYDFVHNALPEVGLNDVTTEAVFLGRKFSFPLFISSMTGGYSEAGAINAQIAEFCERRNLPFGVGSQRAMLEDPSEIESFAIVREMAPNAFIAANIGGAQLIGGMAQHKINLLVDSIRADAVIVHLNPLQELMQPEGDINFEGIETGIEVLAESIDLPLIVKETGAGISKKCAERLLSRGAKVIDVSGAGGTSWAKVENLRERQKNPLHLFDDWGIPTVDCITGVNELKMNYHFEMIASGGIRTSFDIVKSIALGADFTATAQPIIKTLVDDGPEALDTLLDRWQNETAILLTLLGCRHIKEVTQAHLIERSLI
ncbi:MAG: type 2 isopentenyl-diphosphate Delta-isomerase [Balneolaceae bacterium]|nr:type 2 isopentenyl-diphosphate Delta-isomerase [Balneolaceae bacterium]